LPLVFNHSVRKAVWGTEDWSFRPMHPTKRLIAVSDAQHPARNCLVGTTTPIVKCMQILQERIGLTLDECRAIGHGNARTLIP